MPSTSPKRVGRPPIDPAKRRQKLTCRVSAETRAIIAQQPNAGRWLDSVVKRDGLRTRLLRQCLPYLNTAAEEGDSDAFGLSQKVQDAVYK